MRVRSRWERAQSQWMRVRSQWMRVRSQWMRAQSRWMRARSQWASRILGRRKTGSLHRRGMRPQRRELISAGLCVLNRMSLRDAAFSSATVTVQGSSVFLPFEEGASTRRLMAPGPSLDSVARSTSAVASKSAAFVTRWRCSSSSSTSYGISRRHDHLTICACRAMRMASSAILNLKGGRR